MVPIISFVGQHSSGKTSVITKVIEILKSKNYKVAVIKSTIHENVIEDKPGKDTYKFKQVGADSIGIITPSQIILFKENSNVKIEYLAFSMFYDYDIIICEGFKKSDLPKLEVFRQQVNSSPIFKELKNVIGVITDTEIEGIKNFSIDDPETVAKFIEDLFINKRQNERSDIDLFVNDSLIPMKGYVKATLQGVIQGFIENLKGIPYPIKNIDIKIKFK